MSNTLEKKSVGQQIKETLIKDTPRATAAVWVTLAYLLFQLYRTFINPMVPMLVRPIHVSSIGFLCVLLNPGKHKSKAGHAFDVTADWFVFITFFYHIWYALSQFERLGLRVNYLDPVNPIDIFECVTLILLVMLGIYRTVGLTLVIFIGVFIAYVWTARWLPGILYYGGMNISKFTDLMVMGSEGIYGTATGAGSGFMYWIMIFGSLFGTCGGGQVLIDIGIKFGARSNDNSGPAKAAVMASGLMGMISGSAAANDDHVGRMHKRLRRGGLLPDRLAVEHRAVRARLHERFADPFPERLRCDRGTRDVIHLRGLTRDHRFRNALHGKRPDPRGFFLIGHADALNLRRAHLHFDRDIAVTALDRRRVGAGRHRGGAPRGKDSGRDDERRDPLQRFRFAEILNGCHFFFSPLVV